MISSIILTLLLTMKPCLALTFIDKGQLKDTLCQVNQDTIQISGWISSLYFIGSPVIDQVKIDEKSISKAEVKGDVAWLKITPTYLIGKNLEDIIEDNSLKTQVKKGKASIWGKAQDRWLFLKPISEKEKFSLSYQEKGKECKIWIKQSGASELESIDGIKITYQGNSQIQESEIIKEVKDAIKAIKIFISDPHFYVNHIQILDYRKIDGYAAKKESEITIRIPKNGKGLSYAIEHELLHRVIYKEGWDKALTKLWVNLVTEGYKRVKGKNKRDLLKRPWFNTPLLDYDVYGNKLFFDFIKESNLLEPYCGGHPQDNVWEFGVSLVHSLMYWDKVKEKLKKFLRKD